MDLEFTDEERAFRDEVRTFLREKLPHDIAEKVEKGCELGREDYLRWQAILHEKGWLATTWPKEYGGPDWNAVEPHIFSEECALLGAPRMPPFGLNMLGPVLLKFGTEEQKRTILLRILDGSDWWCQGYSEPGAGSDLASLKTRAVRDGDDYIAAPLVDADDGRNLANGAGCGHGEAGHFRPPATLARGISCAANQSCTARRR